MENKALSFQLDAAIESGHIQEDERRITVRKRTREQENNTVKFERSHTSMATLWRTCTSLGWSCVYTREYYHKHREERAASSKWPSSSLEPIYKLQRCTRSQGHTARVRAPNPCSRSRNFCRLPLHDRYVDWI